MAKPTLIEVTAIKPFALGGSEHLPGLVKVPATAVERLVQKSFIEAPETSVEEAPSGLVSQEEVEETVASYLSGTFGIERSSDEPAAEFVARVAKGYQASQGASQTDERGSMDSVLSGIDKRAVSALKTAGFDSLEKIASATDDALVSVPYVTQDNLPKIRTAIQAPTNAAMASILAPHA